MINKHFLSLTVFYLVSTLLYALSAFAESDEFLRLKRDESGTPISMDTAIASYQAKEGSKQAVGVNVDLIGAVHVGEPEYYALLNNRFKEYDAVLFELILPEDLKAPPATEERASNPVSAVQNAVKELLGLHFQLDDIDYHAKNMVHADLTAEAFARSMNVRGESLWTLFMRLMIQGLAEDQPALDPAEELKLLFGLIVSGQSRQYALRRYVALNFQNVKELADKIEGPSGSAIIADRNNRAMEILAIEIAKGRKNIAIFYGAAHLPDMQLRLAKQFGLYQKKIEWIPAWKLLPSSETIAVDGPVTSIKSEPESPKLNPPDVSHSLP